MTITINHTGHYHIDTGNGLVIQNTQWLPEPFLAIACRSIVNISPSDIIALPPDVSRQLESLLTTSNDVAKLDELIEQTVADQNQLETVCPIIMAMLHLADALLLAEPPEPTTDQKNMLAHLVDLCNSIFVAYSQEKPLAGAMFDLDGIRTRYDALTKPEDRIEFFEAILADMTYPIACELVQDSEQYDILVQFQHALDSRDCVYITEVLVDERLHFSENFRRGNIAIPDTPRPLPATSAHRRIEWLGSQTDLVYIIDALKQAGLVRGTDPDIVECFDYQSAAVDRVKTLRDTRKKIRDGASYPDDKLFDNLIKVLSRGRQ